MAKEILILDIGTDSVRGGIFSAVRIEPLYIYSEPVFRQGANLEKSALKSAISSILKTAGEKGFREFGKSLVSIPSDELSMRILSIPFEDRKKIQDVLPFELGGLLPQDAGDMIMDAIPIDKGKVLTASVGKAKLKEYIELLKEFGIDPFWIGSSIFSKGRLLNEVNNGGGMAAFADNESFVVVSNGEPKFFKPARGIDELRISLIYLKAEGIGIERLYSTEERKKDLNLLFPEMDVRIISLPKKYSADEAGLYALSLELKKKMEGAINFRKGELGYTRESDAIKKNLKITGLLVLIAAGLLLGNVYLKYINLTKELMIVKDDLREEYLELFPGETKVLDELYQFEAKRKKLKENMEVIGGGVSVLEVMKELSNAGSGNGNIRVKFNEINIADERMTVKGETDSFESANILRDRLAKEGSFGDIILTDLKAKAVNGVGFSISITLRQRENGI